MAKQYQDPYFLLKGRRAFRPCEHCGTEFSPNPASHGRFCGTKCWYDWCRARRDLKIKPTCKSCGGEIVTTDHPERRQFCSRKCANAALIKQRAVPPPLPDPNARWLPLTCGKFALVDADLFDDLMNRPWTHNPKGPPAHFRRDGTPRSLHRYVMGVDDPAVKVDHRDGNTLDCRRQNLRVATSKQNSHNMRKKTNKTSSKYKGVYFHKTQPGCKKWQVNICVEGRRSFVGVFETEEEAARAYDEVAREAFGAFACVNFPRDGEQGALLRGGVGRDPP